MAGKYTLGLIKPGAVKNGHIGAILSIICGSGFRIAALKMTRLTKTQAEAFYSIHKGKPFFDALIEFMSSGPIVAMLLEKENAVEDYRKLIGATDPSKAAEGTIRKLFATSVQKNAVHGSDCDDNAVIEANFFFSASERFNNNGESVLIW